MAETAIDYAPARVTPDDAHLKAAWARWLTARTQLDALPDLGDMDAQVSAEAPDWAACDAAEAMLLDAVPQTPAGIAIKLRVTLSHMLTDREHDAALRRNDLDYLHGAGLDWAERMLLSLLAPLDAMGA